MSADITASFGMVPLYRSGAPGTPVFLASDGTFTQRDGTPYAKTSTSGASVTNFLAATPSGVPAPTGPGAQYSPSPSSPAASLKFGAGQTANYFAEFDSVFNGATANVTVATTVRPNRSIFATGIAAYNTIYGATDGETGVPTVACLDSANQLYKGSPRGLRGINTGGCLYSGTGTYTYAGTGNFAYTGVQTYGVSTQSGLTNINLNTGLAHVIRGVYSVGIVASVAAALSGRAASVAGAQVQGASSQYANLTIDDLIGLDVVATYGAASVLRNTGIRINAIGGSSAANYSMWINDNSGNITLGTAADTSLRRGAANQLLTAGDWSARHYLCSSTPTVAAGAAAGTGPTISITGTDHGFAVTLTTGTTPTINATLFTVTYGAAWTTSAPQVTYSPGNANAATLAKASTPFVSAVGTTTMTFTSNGTALSATTAYIWRFTAMR